MIGMMQRVLCTEETSRAFHVWCFNPRGVKGHLDFKQGFIQTPGPEATKQRIETQSDT